MRKYFAVLYFIIAVQTQVLSQPNSEANHSINVVFGLSLLITVILLSLAVIGLIIIKRREGKNLLKLTANALRIQKLESEKIQSDLQHQTAELEMQALRAQMNPHFIFNCLNAINHFVLINDVDTASEFLTKFSRLIRMVLQNSFKKDIFLAEELESLRLYIELELIRFNNHFSYSITCGDDLDLDRILIPPMILQPYIENAIWHGLMQSDNVGKLMIEIEQKGNNIEFRIIDNGIGRKKSLELKNKAIPNKKSLGMEITANRLQLLNEEMGNQIKLDIIDLPDDGFGGSGTKVIISMPVKIYELSLIK
jgi:LytS/YehU family sensor histidine kinase